MKLTSLYFRLAAIALLFGILNPCHTYSQDRKTSPFRVVVSKIDSKKIKGCLYQLGDSSITILKPCKQRFDPSTETGYFEVPVSEIVNIDVINHERRQKITRTGAGIGFLAGGLTSLAVASSEDETNFASDEGVLIVVGIGGAIAGGFIGKLVSSKPVDSFDITGKLPVYLTYKNRIRRYSIIKN